MSDRDQANQDPTESRLQRARQEGQAARSRDLAVALVWLGGIALLASFGHWLWTAVDQFSQANWGSFEISTSATESLMQNLAETRQVFWSGLFPILGGVAGLTILTWTAQSGFRFVPKLLIPDLNRLNPARNLREIFAAEQMVSVCLALSKLVLLFGVAAWVVIGDVETLMGLGRGPLRSSSAAMADWLVQLAQRLCIGALTVGFVDYGIRWWLHRQSLMMSEQEVRDERRASEPSSEISARRRARQTG